MSIFHMQLKHEQEDGEIRKPAKIKKEDWSNLCYGYKKSGTEWYTCLSSVGHTVQGSLITVILL